MKILIFQLLVLLPHLLAIQLKFTTGIAALIRSKQSSSTPTPSAHSAEYMHAKQVKGNAHFINRLNKFRNKLYPEKTINDQNQWNKVTNINSNLQQDRSIKWHPVECKTMGIEINIKHYKKKGDGTVLLVSGGEGGGNSVYRIKHENGEEYAYKLFGKSDHYIAELIFLMSIGNQNTHFSQAVCIQGAAEAEGGRGGILMKWVKGGKSSNEYAHHPTTTKSDIQRITAQTFHLLKEMHQMGFVHADLKGDNIMVDWQGNVVIIDFGYTQLVANVHRSRGNRAIRAPELNGLVEGDLSEAIDMWALGMVVAGWHGHAYGYGSHAKRRSNRSKEYKMIYNGSKVVFGTVPSAFPTSLRQLLWILTAPDPEHRRINSEEDKAAVKSLPFFIGIDWDHLI